MFNLGEVHYIDSAGLGSLVGAFTSVRKQNGELKLLNLTNKVRDVMQITKQTIQIRGVFFDEGKKLYGLAIEEGIDTLPSPKAHASATSQVANDAILNRAHLFLLCG